MVSDVSRYNPGPEHRQRWSTYDPQQAKALLDRMGLEKQDGAGYRLRTDGKGRLRIVEARNPAVNAVVARLYDEARAAIRAGLPAGPFIGVPYLLKDLGAHYTGAITSFGSRLCADYRVDYDSGLTARLKRAGLVIFGKTNTPELGLAPSTEPRLFGATRNPWHPAHSAGGSIRIPASCCGLVGLKPTRARNPLGPDQGEGWGGASVAHAITRTVRDSAPRSTPQHWGLRTASSLARIFAQRSAARSPQTTWSG